MTHFTVMKICDALQEARNRMLELNQSEDASLIEEFYQKYIKLYHEHLRN